MCVINCAEFEIAAAKIHKILTRSVVGATLIRSACVKSGFVGQGCFQDEFLMLKNDKNVLFLRPLIFKSNK